MCIQTGKLVSDNKPAQARHRRVLPQEPGGDGAGLLRAAPGDRSRRRRSPPAATSTSTCRSATCRATTSPADTRSSPTCRKLSEDGLKQRLAEISKGRAVDERAYRERLDHELSVIQTMGFSGYFLIVWDFINYAKHNAIPVGPGRGSGAGSLVASRTAGSPTSIRCRTTCSSSASSTPSGSACPTSTSISACTAETR